ncbi:MAG: DNA-3-methyladenine glycosylase [Chloroflexota bacterium]
MILPVEFYQRPTLTVARLLLGSVLVRQVDGTRRSGVIVETEAYVGESDLACHARAGRTQRTTVMYGRAGTAYVYFTYGMHWLLNAVTEQEGFPAAVLLRAILPLEGAGRIAEQRRGGDTRGPAKLTQALSIDGTFNGADLTRPLAGLWIEAGDSIPDENVTIGPRVGLNTVPEPWKSKPWRFLATAGSR